MVATCLGAVFGFGGVADAGKAPSWTITDLGTLPGHPYAFVRPTAVNDGGAVVAESYSGSGPHPTQQAFVWRSGKKTRLTYGNSTWIDVAAINNRGDIVGDAASADRNSQVSVLWRNGKATLLGTLGGTTSYPVAINNHDQVIGISRTPTALQHGFIWQNGTMTDLGTLGGDATIPIAINDKGQVVGQSTTATGADHAFLWQNGTMTDLGTLNGHDSIARAINDSGEIVGELETHLGNAVEAVAWKNDKLTELGTFGTPSTRALAINGQGDILIEVDDNNSDPSGGIVLRSNGQPTKIPGLGGSAPAGQGGAIRLVGLNNRGQVAGFGYARQSARRTFIWQNGHTTILPTFDGVSPPWGDPTSLNNNGVLIGTSYVSHGGKNFQHAVVWRP